MHKPKQSLHGIYQADTCTYFLGSCHFCKGDIVTDGEGTYEVTSDPIMIYDPHFGIMRGWIYSFNKPIPDPVDKQLWKN